MKEKLKNKLKFTLGDWSDDGHGKTRIFYVKSNKSVDEFREAHFKFADKYFDIGSLCSEYGDYSIHDEETMNKMKKLNLWNEEFHDYVSPEDLMDVWLNAINIIMPDFRFNVEVNDKWEDVHFYGYDEKKRHLNVPGYGLFE